MKVKENEIILELCKWKSFDKKKIEILLNESYDFSYILGQLLFNRMGGAAYYVLKRCDLLGNKNINREFRNTLESIFLNNIKQSQTFKDMLNNLVSIFHNVEQKYVFLKGSYLVFIYPLGLRTSNDYDLLLKKEESKQICINLQESGFEQGFVRGGNFVKASRRDIVFASLNKGEDIPFVKKVNLEYMKYCEVDLNYSLDYKPVDSSKCIDDMLSRRVRIEEENTVLYTLGKYDFIIHLCLHLYKEATMFFWVERGRDLSIYKFCDIYSLLHDYVADDFGNLKSLIKEYSLETECYYAIYYTKVLFNMDTVELKEFLNAIRPIDESIINNVYDPLNKKIYMFSNEIKERLFYSNRLKLLNELK